MRIILAMAAAAALLALTGGGTPVVAQPLDATTPSCVGLAGTPQAAQVWWGRFAGGREQPTGGTTAPIGISTEGCFPSRAACEHWRYVMKGAYSALLMPPGTNGCSRGYRG
jgi:hypothetical protein